MSEPKRNKELEAQIERDPTDASFLVYGDWLQQQGDPRGELMALQHQRLSARGPEFARLMLEELALLSREARHFYGPLTRFRAARLACLQWHLGFVCTARGDAVKPEFLDHPSARFIRALHSGHLTRPLPLLECFTGGGPLDWVWTSPRLRRLHGWDRTVSPPPEHVTLERWELYRPDVETCDRIGQMALPRLRRLGLRGLVHMSGLASLARRHPAAELSLGLDGAQWQGDFEALRELGPRVRALRLDGFALPALESLESLELAGVQSLEVAAPDSAVRNQVFERLPTLPALKIVELFNPSDLVGFFRGFARCELASRIEGLEVFVSKPGAGRALTEGSFPGLTHLSLHLDSHFSVEYLQTERFFAAGSFPALKVLQLSPAQHLAPLALSPLAARLEGLSVRVDRNRDAAVLIKHLPLFPRLKWVRLEGDRVIAPELLTELYQAAVELTWAGIEAESVLDELI